MPASERKERSERDVVLRGRTLLVHGRERELGPGVSARVEAYGSRVETEGRAPGLRSWLVLGPLALALLRRRRVDDARRLLLVVEGPGLYEQVDCTGAPEVEIRLMASRINAVCAKG